MRVVVDANVLVSGLLNPFGAAGRIVDPVVGERVELLVDDRVLGEYRRVLAPPRFGFDPGDQTFLEVAIAGCADVLVTGNLRHFGGKRTVDRVRVTSPAAFLLRSRQRAPSA